MPRFRRFRRRVVRRGGFTRRPTWRRSYDLAFDDAGRGPYRTLSALPTDANFLPLAAGGDQFVVFGGGTGATASTSITVFGSDDMDFFEGECTIVRLIGELYIPVVTTDDFSAGDEARTIEVRAWMFKTWEQETNNRTGLVHPFNVEDFDARILWMAKWRHLLQSQFVPITDGWANIVPATFTPSGALAATPAFGAQVQSYNDLTFRRTFSIRQPIRMKGNERLAIAIAAGPFLNAGRAFMPVGGHARMLVRH